MTKIWAIIAGVAAVIARIRVILAWGVDKWAKISPIVTPLIAEAEQMAQDGEIDKNERKQLVLKGVALLESKGYIKLNCFTRWVAGIIIDRIAGKLPNFKITQQAKDILTAVKHQ